MQKIYESIKILEKNFRVESEALNCFATVLKIPRTVHELGE